jgi:FSR family fosmidomycin resistance protein-like MFS transporter
VTATPINQSADLPEPAFAPTAAERFQVAGVITVAAGHALHDTYTAFLPPLLPVLIEKFSLSTAQAGLLSVFMQWPSLLQPFIGYLADHVNLRYFVILAPALTATAMSLLGVAPGYAVLAMLLIVVGVSSAGLHAVGPVIAGHLSGRNLGRGMGLWMVGGGLGYTIGPILLVAAVQSWGLHGTPLLMAGGWLASAVLFVRLRAVTSRPTRFVTGRAWRQALFTLRPLLVPVIGIIVTRSFMSAALGTYLPTFLSREGSSLWFAGAALSIFEAAGMIGALAIGSLSDRLGRRRLLAAAMAATSLLMGGFLVTRGLVQFPILLALGFCALSIMPVMMALLQESFPETRALVNGIYLGLSFVAQAAATVALGALADRYGLRAAFTASAIIPLLGLPLILLLPRN